MTHMNQPAIQPPRQRIEIDDDRLKAQLAEWIAEQGDDTPDGDISLECFGLDDPIVALDSLWEHVFFAKPSSVLLPDDLQNAEVCLYPVRWESDSAILLTVREGRSKFQLSTFSFDPWRSDHPATEVVAEIVETANEMLDDLRALIAAQPCER